MIDSSETLDRPAHAPAPRLIGYGRVSTGNQFADRQNEDLLAAGVRRHDIYMDRASGGTADRPGLQQALDALYPGDTLVVTTLDRLGRSVTNMLELARGLRDRGVNLKVLNLGGASVDTTTPIGSMVFTIMAALAEMELEIKKERIRDSVAKRRAAGRDLGGRSEQYSDRMIRFVELTSQSAGYTVARACKEIGISRATYYRRLAELQSAGAGAASSGAPKD